MPKARKPATPPPSSALAQSIHGAQIRRFLERAAPGDAPVLILGESGTGRSSLARLFHTESPRAHGPLVEVDLAALPVDLFESELFGYRAGAFTGAERSSPGRLGRADGGTLVLDRLEAMPLEVQPKLLRVVAERRYSPLGGRERGADVRFVAVGEDELPLRVRQGAFRADLFYRFEVLTIRLLPLRERKRELPALAQAVLADLCARMGSARPEIADSAWAWMRTYSWPGNLRQLRNVLERALILGGEGPLDPPPPGGVDEERPRPLEVVEAEEIRRALAYTRGHQGKAAQLLGISRKSLWEKRRRYGVP